MNYFIKSIIINYLLFYTHFLYAFDHQHKQWNSLLQDNVYLSSNASISKVDYTQFKKKSSQLSHYLKALSGINKKQFKLWSKDQQKAFLINAYNAYTIELVLSEYPDLESIKDIGSFFSNPWKKQFFILLENKRSLDDLEHKLLRQEGVYDDPYIHVALVCASIGCPALRNEAYTADKIEQQLTSSMQRFLSDKQRNQYNSDTNTLEVSKIFDWYKNDFTRGHRGLFSLSDLFAQYSDALSNDPKEQNLIRLKRVQIDFLDYDWRLNDWNNEY